MRTPIAIAAVALVATASLPAQSPVGKLEGTISEKLASRSVSDAWVSLLRVDPASDVTLNARPDVNGRFHVDSLPAGRYRVIVSSPTLDSLDLSLPPSELRIDSGETARADFALPFGSGLRDVVCYGLRLGPGTAVVAGRAIDADDDKPIPHADVIAAWTDISFDKATLKATSQKRFATVVTDPQGEYRLCGVPAGTLLSLQLQHGGRAGAVIRLRVSEEEGAVVRDISMSTRTAPTIAELDSLASVPALTSADAARGELALTGTSGLTGYVRGSEGRPLDGVEVRVRDARSSAVTDSTGRFVLGDLPSGTQVVVIHHLGYAFAEVLVELRPGKNLARDIRLTRATRLDSVRVVASRPGYPEFELHRRTNPLGKFLTFEDIQRRDAKETSDLIRMFGDFTVIGRGADARVVSRSAVANPLCRTANVVIDGVQETWINQLDPRQIGAIEAYRDGTSIPATFAGRTDCGVIMIWMRIRSAPGKRSTPSNAGALQWNGYP
jgi:hypothetical protein